MATVFRDHGLKYLEVEFLADFFTPQGSEARKASDASAGKLFETAAAFDAHHIKVGNIPETPCELDRVIEEYAALCDDAANHTDAKVAYEIIPFDPNVGTLEAGLRLVTEAAPAQRRPGHRHLAHGQAARSTPSGWRRSRPSTSPGSSCPTDSSSTWRTSSTRSSTTASSPARASSTSPGYVNALHRAGYPGPWGAEILSEKLRNLPIEQEFDRAYETTLAQVRAGVE